MMYDELIYWMRYCSDDKPICEKMYDCPFYDESENNSAYYLCGERMLKKAADAIEELEQENEKLRNDLGKAIRILITKRWIPVTERLPENGAEVLAFNKTGFAYVDCWTDGKWKINSMVDEEHEYVTHWMPLPQPPKEET